MVGRTIERDEHSTAAQDTAIAPRGARWLLSRNPIQYFAEVQLPVSLLKYLKNSLDGSSTSKELPSENTVL